MAVCSRLAVRSRLAVSGQGGAAIRLLAALLVAAAFWAPMTFAADYAITGGRVHTQTEAGTLTPAVVLVSAGRIKAIATDLTVPPGYRVVDAGGKIVTPGLIESYSQLGLEEISGEASTVDSQVVGYPAGPAFDVRYALNEASTAIAVNRRDGVTRAIVAPHVGNDPLAGFGVAVRLTDTDILTRVDVGLFGALDADAAAYTGGSRSALVQRLRRGLELARRYNPNRYRPGPGDYSQQDLAALNRFLALDAPLVLEVHRAADIRQALALAEDFGLRLVVLGGTEAWRERAQLAARQVPVMVNVLANLPQNFERLGARLDNAALLQQAGVRLLLTGGETQNVRWLRQAAGNAIAHGLPWDAALTAMTRSPGEVWGLAEGQGTLAAGAPADLVIWNGDPFELDTWPERVMIDGEWQDLSSRQTRLFERYRRQQDGDGYYP